MKYFIPTLFLLIAVGCKKPDDTAPQVPAFSCDNSIDDGKYEEWNDAERGLLQMAFTGNGADNAVQSVSINKNQITYKDSLSIAYVQAYPVTLYTSVAFRKEGRVLQSTIRSWKNLAPGAVRQTVWGWIPGLNDTTALPGCNRMYYLFADSTGRALNKGHFDFNITP